MPRSFESRAFRAVSGSDSLKTTVPQSVATVLGLEPGDSIVWTVDVAVRSATVSKGSKEENESSGGEPRPNRSGKKRSKVD